MVIGMLFLTAIVCLPLILCVVAIWRPLKVAADATSFEGRSGWKLTHVTGKVLASNSVTRTHGSGGVYGSARSVRITSDVHETLRLQTSPATQTDVEVVNYSVNAQPGDMVSVWNARNGGRRSTIAALNHTTNRQSVNDVDVFSILQPYQPLFVVYVIFCIIPIALFSFAGGALPFGLYLALLVLYYVGQKRVRGNYEESGIDPIWKTSRAEASQLSSL